LVENLPRQLENSSLTKSSALGLLGIPGLTAYIGLMEIGKPKVTILSPREARALFRQNVCAKFIFQETQMLVEYYF
jgi:hypothetical protein